MTWEVSEGVAEAMEREVGEQGSACWRVGSEGCAGGSEGDVCGSDGGCGSAGEWEGALGGSDVADEGGADDTVWGVELARGESERGCRIRRESCDRWDVEGDAEGNFRGARWGDDGRRGGRSEAADGRRGRREWGGGR